MTKCEVWDTEEGKEQRKVNCSKFTYMTHKLQYTWNFNKNKYSYKYRVTVNVDFKIYDLNYWMICQQFRINSVHGMVFSNMMLLPVW